ncbi:hypothetical protein [uncultured Zoogloea sp.]|uniref:hypothetical protein n=1 Tax=uncultured Zoogloea sp. TaxID=160237 RepID=UPI0026031653|nr:hypothetical protein [uncultured Zoogloea sp.]
MNQQLITYDGALELQPGAARNGRVVPFRLATAAKDRHTTIFVPTGCRYQNFLKNPVFTWNHQDALDTVQPEDVLGLVVQLEVTSDAVLIWVEFDTAPKAERCFQMVLKGLLRAVSIRAGVITKHQEGGVDVIDEWELYSASLCVVGSNPEALALRSLLSSGKEINRMTRDELCKALGLEPGCPQTELLMALLGKWAEGDEEKKAQLEAAKSDAPAAEEDRKRSCDTEEMQRKLEGLKTANKMLQEQVRSLQAVAAPAKTAEQFADEAIKDGRWPLATRSELVSLARSAPKAAEAAVSVIDAGTFKPHQSSLQSIAQGQKTEEVTRKAPNLGSHERAQDDDGCSPEVKAGVKAKFKEIQADNARRVVVKRS